MDQIGHPRAVLAAFFAVATLTAGCSASTPAVPSGVTLSQGPTTVSPRVPTISSMPPSRAVRQPLKTVSDGRHGGRGGSIAGSAAAGGLPAGWPTDLPVPQGGIMGSTGSAGQWTVLIVAAGSAAEVRRSTLAFYSAAGFTPVSDSILNKGNRQITLVVENRDHSATQTNLVIGVTTQ
jgi:hypothetical protein